MDIIYFYAKDEPYGEFSNFAPYGIEMESLWWPTVEHYFQAQKFSDSIYQSRIRTEPTARKAAELGRSRKLPIKPDWEEIKNEVMYQSVLKKFQTHDKLKTLLLATKDAVIIENSLSDYYWGSDRDGTGLNQLGKIIMKVRNIISSSEPD